MGTLGAILLFNLLRYGCGLWHSIHRVLHTFWGYLLKTLDTLAEINEYLDTLDKWIESIKQQHGITC